jgi:hypothetical protein
LFAYTRYLRHDEDSGYYVEVERIKFHKEGNYEVADAAPMDGVGTVGKPEPKPVEWIDPDEESEWSKPESWVLPGKYSVQGRRVSLLRDAGKLSDLLAELDRPLGPMVPCYADGTRVVIQSPVDLQGSATLTGCIGTIGAVADDGHYKVVIDNARAAGSSDDPFVVTLPLGQWDHWLAKPFEGHAPGAQLAVADGRGGWMDAEVIEHVGNSAYKLNVENRVVRVTLNSANHASRDLSRSDYTSALDG